MKKLILILLLLFPLGLFSQRVPDNEEILRTIIDSQSPYFYPALMIRYEAGDTTLTDDDFYYLYYGYAFQEEYKPLEPISGEDKLYMVLERGLEPTDEDAHEIIKYATEVMKADPFSPKNINFLIYAYGIVGDTVNAELNAYRLDKIVKTIQTSGTGLKESSPWHVLWFSHATDVLATKGLEALKRTVRTRTVEYIQLVKRDGDVKGYYFDFGRVYWRKPENTTQEKRVDGFNINGIRVGGKRNLNTPSR